MGDGSILIAGTGALATLFAAHLGSAGIPVKMLGSWPEATNTIRSNGVQSIDETGQITTSRVQIYNRPEEVGTVDHALLLVKSWQTRHYALQLKECISENGIVLTLQNGLGNLEILAETLGSQRCLAGAVLVGAAIMRPGMVRMSGNPIIQLEKDARLDALVKIFTMSGFKVETFDDLKSLIWGKLIINSGINPLSAILGVTNGVLGTCQSCRPLLKDLAREGERTADAYGIKLPYDDSLAAMEYVIQNTAKNTSSMLQDVRRGAPTEIDAINGEIVRYAHMAGLSVPVNECFVSLIKAKVNLSLV